MAGWIQADLAAGKLTPEQATQQFNELGRMEQQEPDQQSDEQREIDRHFGEAEKPEQFTIRYGLPDDGKPMSPEHSRFDASTREWLSGAGFERNVGNSVVANITKVIQHTQKMTEAELESYGIAEFAKLEKAYGPILDDKLRATGRMVEALEHNPPGLKNVLRRVGDNALVASLIIQQAERYWARRR